MLISTTTTMRLVKLFTFTFTLKALTMKIWEEAVIYLLGLHFGPTPVPGRITFVGNQHFFVCTNLYITKHLKKDLLPSDSKRTSGWLRANYFYHLHNAEVMGRCGRFREEWWGRSITWWYVHPFGYLHHSKSHTKHELSIEFISIHGVY